MVHKNTKMHFDFLLETLHTNIEVHINHVIYIYIYIIITV